jgi:hypothetical protein
MESKQHTSSSWTREELSILEKEWASSSATQIALKLGRSVKSVIAKAYRMGLPLKRHQEYKGGSKPVIAYEADGTVRTFRSGVEAAAHYGIKRSLVYKLIITEGVAEGIGVGFDWLATDSEMPQRG